MPITPYEWEESVFGEVTELMPQDAPTPKRKNVIAVSYHDANLHYNCVTGTSVVGIIHFTNKNPMDWRSKK